MNVTGAVNEPDSQTQNIVSYDQIKIKIDGGHVWVRFLLNGEEQAQVNGPMIGPNSGEPTINITIGAEGSVRSKP